MTLTEIESILNKKSVSKFVNEYILSNQPVCFKDNEEFIWEIKDLLSNQFKIHKKDIEIVGSGKLGISLSDERFGKEFSIKSDVDIALVSPELFNIAWNELLTLDFLYFKLSDRERQELKDSYQTIHRGFISPERLPKTIFKEQWWKVFEDLSNKPKYEYRKIRGRLFRNWSFVENYYSIKIRKIKMRKNDES
jgi:hypothetical protein